MTTVATRHQLLCQHKRLSCNYRTAMAHLLKRPLLSAAVLKQTVRAPCARNLHKSIRSKIPSSTPLRSGPASAPVVIRLRHAFQSTFRRPYMEQPYQAARVDRGDVRQRLLFGAGIFGGTLFAINMIFNRETRDDGGMPPYEREYLNVTFMHTGLGVGIIAIAARTLHSSGWSLRLMATNPWAVMGLGLVGSIGTMMGTFATSPEKYLD